MRRMILLALAATVAGPVRVDGQDLFPLIRLTSDSVRDGFPSWSPDGKTLVYSFFDVIDGRQVFGARTIPSDGGTPQTLTEFITEHPQWSPDGRFILFDADMGTGIGLLNAAGGKPRRLLPDSLRLARGGLPLWSPDGSRFVFKHDSTSSLLLFELATGAVTRVFDGEGRVPIPGCWSRDGKAMLIALMDRVTRKSTIWSISPDGKERRQITGHREGFYRYLALSPDGRLLVYGAVEEGKVGLWVMPSGGGPSLPLAVSTRYHSECPAWSPDGRRIAFASGMTGNGDIYVTQPDLEAVREKLGVPKK